MTSTGTTPTRRILTLRKERALQLGDDESSDPMLTRRKFLATTACTVIAAHLHAQGQSKVRVALSIPKETSGPLMPSDFVGLSYEVQQLADPSFFSAQNSGLIREFKALSSTGVLRLGGNTSSDTFLTASGVTA